MNKNIKAILFLCFFLLLHLLVSCRAINLDYQKQDYNVVLIVVNVLRSDHVSCYGYHRETTPAIDEMAKESFIFKNAFCQAGYTLPSMMSIITSLYPKSHGVMDICKDKLTTHRIYTMAEILKIYNYKTAWFSMLNDPHVDINVGFGRGFDYLGQLREMHFNDGFRRNHNGKKELLSWLEKNKNNKFFLAINTRDIHTPYFPLPQYQNRFFQSEKDRIIDSPEEFNKVYYRKIIELNSKPGSLIYGLYDKPIILTDKELFNGKYKDGKIATLRSILPSFEKHKLDPIIPLAYYSEMNLADAKIREQLISLYDACIIGIDQGLIKPILSKLKELNVYDNTIIIITADHGDAFGDHGGFGHGMEFYDELIHVPLIIKVPHYPKGREIKPLVQSIDIFPTVLDILNLEIPYYAQGKSALPLIENKKKSIHKFIYGQNNNAEYLRSHRWKFIFINPKLDVQIDELYNLKVDPEELRNLCYRYPEVYFELKKNLEDFSESLPSYKDEESSFLPFVDAETQKRIKKTGYW